MNDTWNREYFSQAGPATLPTSTRFSEATAGKSPKNHIQMKTSSSENPQINYSVLHNSPTP